MDVAPFSKDHRYCLTLPSDESMRRANEISERARTGPKRVLLLSLKPRHANAILRGEKTAELRRVKPHAPEGTCTLIYSSSPVSSIVGLFVAGEIVGDDLDALWRVFRERLALSKCEFDDYVAGLDKAFVIPVKTPLSLEQAISLDQLRARIPGFHPPQSYRFAPPELLEAVVTPAGYPAP